MTDSADAMILAPTLAALGDDPRRGLDRLHDAGFRAVQLSAAQPGLRPRELDGSARRDLLATLRRTELLGAGIDCWIPAEHYRDAAQLDRAVNATRAAIELAADLGRLPVSLNLPRAAPMTADGDPDGSHDDSSIIEAIDALATHAERFGIALADHTHPPLAVPRGSAAVGIGIDPAAIIARGESPARAVAAAGERIISARLCDLLRSGMRGPPGDADDGQLDVMAYRAALSVVGYARPVIVDARQWSGTWTGLAQTAAAWAACTPF